MRDRPPHATLQQSLLVGYRLIERTREYDTPLRISIFPLLDWRWNRRSCLEYLWEQFGAEVAHALMLEHVSLSMNPRGTLYPAKALIQITLASGNQAAIETFKTHLNTAEWAVYRVRRLYHPAKDKNGVVHFDKNGSAIRAVERLNDSLTHAEAESRLRDLISPGCEVAERRGITYVYRQRCGEVYPTREEFLVAAPAVVAAKARYGMEWFERQWDSPQLSLFE